MNDKETGERRTGNIDDGKDATMGPRAEDRDRGKRARLSPEPGAEVTIGQPTYQIRGLPALTKKRPLKEAGGPDWRRSTARAPFHRDLDPELREFPFPDFGFRDDLNYSESQTGNRMSSVWHLLFDHIQAHPKYERLKAVIDDMTNQKLLQIQQRLEQENSKKQSTAPLNKQSFKGVGAAKKASLAFQPPSNEAQATLNGSGRSPWKDGGEGSAKKKTVISKEQRELLEQNQRELALAAASRVRLDPEMEEYQKAERYRNPITWVPGQKTSSQAMRLVWIELNKLMLSNQETIKKFEKLQTEFSLQTVQELIQELEFKLRSANPGHSKNKNLAKLLRRASITKLQKLYKKQKVMMMPSFRASSLQLSKYNAYVESHVDNKMDPKYVLKQNETLRKVPNFVQLNMNSNEQFDHKQFMEDQDDTFYNTPNSVESDDGERQNEEKQTSILKHKHTIKSEVVPGMDRRLDQRQGTVEDVAAADVLAAPKVKKRGTIIFSQPPIVVVPNNLDSSKMNVNQQRAQAGLKAKPLDLAALNRTNQLQPYGQVKELSTSFGHRSERVHLNNMAADGHEVLGVEGQRSRGPAARANAQVLLTSDSNFGEPGTPNSLFSKRLATSQIIRTEQYASASHANPSKLEGARGLSAFEQYKRFKQQLIRSLSPNAKNNIINRLQQQKKNIYTQKSPVKIDLQPIQQKAIFTLPNRNAKPQPRKPAQDTESLHKLGDELYTRVLSAFQTLHKLNVRQRPSDLRILTLLKRQIYHQIDPQLHFSILKSMEVFSQLEIEDNNGLIALFTNELNAFAIGSRMSAEELRPAPDLETGLYVPQTAQSALSFCTQARARLDKYYLQGSHNQDGIPPQPSTQRDRLSATNGLQVHEQMYNLVPQNSGSELTEQEQTFPYQQRKLQPYQNLESGANSNRKAKKDSIFENLSHNKTAFTQREHKSDLNISSQLKRSKMEELKSLNETLIKVNVKKELLQNTNLYSMNDKPQAARSKIKRTRYLSSLGVDMLKGEAYMEGFGSTLDNTSNGRQSETVYGVVEQKRRSKGKRFSKQRRMLNPLVPAVANFGSVDGDLQRRKGNFGSVGQMTDRKSTQSQLYGVADGQELANELTMPLSSQKPTGNKIQITNIQINPYRDSPKVSMTDTGAGTPPYAVREHHDGIIYPHASKQEEAL